MNFLSDKEVVLFGSYASGEAGPRSDIDVAIVTRLDDQKEMMQIRIEAAGKAPDCYDIQVFEALPLILQGAIVENFVVLFGDPLEIGMYFYHIRKIWDDYRHRIEVPTIDEIRKGIAES